MQLQVVGHQEQERTAVAEALEALIYDWDEQLTVKRVAAEDIPADDRKAVDPFSLAALILSIPSAALAVADLADRVNKRRRAKQLIDRAEKLRSTHRVEIYVTTSEGPARLAAMPPDRLLELRMPPEGPPTATRDQ